MFNKDKYALKPITENPIILDFTGCKHINEIHKILKIKFGLPEYYGENADALWDLLDGLFYGMDEVTAQIYGFNTLEEKLKKYTAVLLEVLDDVAKETPNFSYKIIS